MLLETSGLTIIQSNATISYPSYLVKKLLYALLRAGDWRKYKGADDGGVPGLKPSFWCRKSRNICSACWLWRGWLWMKLSTMKTKIASGPDNISSHMLKNIARSISPFLHKLFNLSLSTGQLPSEWKVSNVSYLLQFQKVGIHHSALIIDPSPVIQNSWTHHSQPTSY